MTKKRSMGFTLYKKVREPLFYYNYNFRPLYIDKENVKVELIMDFFFEMEEYLVTVVWKRKYV